MRLSLIVKMNPLSDIYVEQYFIKQMPI